METGQDAPSSSELDGDDGGSAAAQEGVPATGRPAAAAVRRLRRMDDPEVLERVLAGLLNLR